MPLREHPDLKTALVRTTTGMLSYLDYESATYEEEDIDGCRDILLHHADELEQASTRDEALKIVETTVNQLNDLNERAGQNLIETGERENICEFIIRAGAIMGFNRDDEDITEEWREW